MSATQLMRRAELDEVGLRFGTDKASSSHDFLRYYQPFIQSFVDQSFTLLELGVGPTQNMGKSLLMWRDYFPKAKIVGVDDKPIAKTVETDRVTVEIGDLGQIEFLQHLAATYKPHVIIDDASHIWAHQVLGLEMLFPSLAPDGVYIVEDLHTSYGELGVRYGQGQYQNAVSYLTTLATMVCGTGRGAHESYATQRPTAMQSAIAERVDTITFGRHTAVLTKKGAPAPRRAIRPPEDRVVKKVPDAPPPRAPVRAPERAAAPAPAKADAGRPATPAAPAVAGGRTGVQFLFVGGPQRSGTTAFATMINRHPQIAIGIERYKSMYNRFPKIGSDLFNPSRFTTIGEGEVDIDWSRYGGKDQFRSKLEGAAVRGDKIPHIMRYQRRISEGLPDAKFMIMYRDIHRVCASWNRRALNEKDAWSAENDFKKAVDVINDELKRALAFHKKHPNHCLLVRYENIFGEAGVSSMTRILDWLGVAPDQGLLKSLQMNNARVAPTINEKPILELDGQREFVLAGIDWDMVKEVEAVAV